MAQNNWTSNSSGSWWDAADWSTGAVPGATDNVYIEVPGVTVSISANPTAAEVETLNTVNSTLDIDGGTLFTVQSAVFDGAFDETSGTFMMSGHGASFVDGMNFSGGTIDDLSGAVQLIDGGSLSGTLAGAGALDVIDGTAYLNKGFSATIDSIVVGQQGGKLGLNTNFTYAGNFTLLAGGSLDLFGQTMKLSGTTLLDGVTGNGKLTDSGTMILGGPNATATLDNGLLLSVTKFAEQGGFVNLGANDSAAQVTISKTGTYEINGNWDILNSGSVATVSNAGVFTKASGGETSRVDASFSSTGTVAVQIGTLLLNGLVNSLAGTISGNGTLGIAGGQTTLANKIALNVGTLDQQSGILVVNNAITYAGAWNMTGGVLDLNAGAAKLDLTGQANLDGGTITSFGGGITIAGTANVADLTFGGPTTVTIDGTLDQTGTILFGESSNPVADIASGGTWTLESDSSILGDFGLIENNGNFIDPNGSGDAVVQSELVNSGTLTVNNSTLTLAGTNTLTGVLKGNGLLDVANTTTLGSGLKITVAKLAVDNSYVLLAANQSFANNFIESGGAAVLDLGGNSFSLSGATTLDSGLLTDGGTLSAAGPTVLGNYAIGGDSTLLIDGVGEQTGQLNLLPNSGPGTLDIGATGSYTLDDDIYIIGDGSVLNSGTFTAAGTGTSQIAAAFTNGSAAKLVVNDQLLQLGGGGSFSGSISGAGTLMFSDFGGTTVYQLNQGLSLTTGAWSLSVAADAMLTANVGYAGQFSLNSGTVQLGGDTLTLSGGAALTAGEMTGPGTLVASGSSTLANISVLQSSVLDITGHAEQTATITVGDYPSLEQPPSAAELLISSGATYALDANNSIAGNGTLAVAGTLTAGGDGVSVIGATVVDSGVIAANLGTLQLLSGISGSGAFSIGVNGMLQFDSTATIAASNSIDFTSGGGALILDNPAAFLGTIDDFATKDTIGLYGFDPGSLTGSYANAADTQITFSDAYGHSTTITFGSAQNLTNFTYEAGPQGLATILHN
jgi:hypothetical protein